MFKSREVIKKSGYTFSIGKFIGVEKWNLVREYSNDLGGNKVFDSREQCLEFIDKYIAKKQKTAQ